MVVGSNRLLLLLTGTGLAAPWHLPVREGLIPHAVVQSKLRTSCLGALKL